MVVLHTYKQVELLQQIFKENKPLDMVIISYDEKPGIQAIENQTACGHPTLKDGVCFGPHALTPGFMESRNRRVFVAQIPLIRIIVTLFSAPRESLLIKSKKI